MVPSGRFGFREENGLNFQAQRLDHAGVWFPDLPSECARYDGLVLTGCVRYALQGTGFDHLDPLELAKFSKFVHDGLCIECMI